MNTTDDGVLRQALKQIRANEGGFVDDPADSGGATHYGVSLRFLRAQGADIGDIDSDGDIDADDIRALTPAMAEALFVRVFWHPGGYQRLPGALAIKTFDLAVNMGPKSAARVLQRALRACEATITDDGIIGTQTIAAAWHAPALAGRAAMRSEAAGFYRTLTAHQPRLARFLRGWLIRAYQ